MTRGQRWLLAGLRGLFRHLGQLPPEGRARWARPLGWLAPRLMKRRAHIVRTNLGLCFPDWNAARREAELHRHFQLLARSVVDRGVLWFAPRETVEALFDFEGLEHVQALQAEGRPIILLVPHFIGLDASASQITMALPQCATLYSPQRSPAVDTLIREGRARFNDVRLISRREGVRGLIRQLREGVPIYYLPDMDFGLQGAVFAPFFGLPAATLLSTAQIAQSRGAAVVPLISRLDLDSGRYTVRLLPPLDNFPGPDGLEAATLRMNRLIEDWIRDDPAQYYWVHRRFKTRPPGEPKLY